MDLGAVRTAVAANLATVPGLRVFDYRPDAIPAGVAEVAVVEPDDPYVAEYFQSFANGTALVGMKVTVYVQSPADGRSAQARMDELLSSGSGLTRSIVDALMDDRTLGGLTGGMTVREASRPQYEDQATGRCLTSELTLIIPVGRR